MKKIIKRQILPRLLVVLFFFICETSLSQVKEFTGKNITQPSYSHLGKYLKKYSVYALDLNAIAGHVKSYSQKAQFILNLASQQFKLEIEPNEMRGQDFKAVAMTAEGSGELAQTFASTYKGFENNNHANIVRLNINETTFEGYIHVGSKWLYFDKLNRYLPNESNNKIVVYNDEDVIPDLTRRCGATIINDEKKRFIPNTNDQNLTVTGNCHFVEIATEADFEYYQAFSNNADAALSRIREILNLVEGLYTPSFNVKFIIKYQQIWTTQNDPYSGDNLETILPQFKSWWSSNRFLLVRDVTHFFTGRTVNNSTIGLAYVGAVCNNAYYYSCVVNYSPINNATISLSAHELGHNFGANHDADCNGNNIMCPYIQQGTPEWTSQSVTEISNYISGSGSCMTQSIPVNATISGSSSGDAYLKIIASNNISINSLFGAIELNTDGFGYIEAGTRIVFTPTVDGTLGFLAPKGSVLLMRISDVVNSCDPLIADFSGYSLRSASQYNNSNVKNSDIQIRPNPFEAVFELIINSKEIAKAHVSIYSALGTKVKDRTSINLVKGFNKLPFNCSILSAGVYLVEIDFGNFKILKKVIKI